VDSQLTHIKNARRRDQCLALLPEHPNRKRSNPQIASHQPILLVLSIAISEADSIWTSPDKTP
jgi:hypothetical protein